MKKSLFSFVLDQSLAFSERLINFLKNKKIVENIPSEKKIPTPKQKNITPCAKNQNQLPNI